MLSDQPAEPTSMNSRSSTEAADIMESALKAMDSGPKSTTALHYDEQVMTQYE